MAIESGPFFMNISECQHKLGVEFRDPQLLEQALVHSSYLNECPECGTTCNERLEFLGDAVLGMVVAEHLYCALPAYQEGRLTAIRSTLVRRESLATAAARIGLGDCLRLGKGEDASGGRTKPKNLADAFEAIVGALYLDQGLTVAAAFVLRHLGLDEASHAAHNLEFNHKALLQETLQANNDSIPQYKTVLAVGPDHDKQFTVEVLVDGLPLGRGTGRTKKSAEFAAARDALESLRTREE